MSVRVAQVAFDCRQAERLAQFWAAVLQRPIDPGAGEYFATVGRSGEDPLPAAFMFVKVPEDAVGKNRIHVDLVSPDRASDVARAVAAGAEVVGEFDEHGTAWTTLRDPEGNVFDIGAGLGADVS